MRQLAFLTIIFVGIGLLFSCTKEKEPEPESEIKEESGTLWLSGGLYFCAEQIRLDTGDTLIVVNREKIYSFTSGDRIQVKYYETEQNESGCNIGKDCEIVEIREIE